MITVVVCLCSSTVFAQTGYNYSDYTRKEIFKETFVDNRNGWRKFYTKIKKGRYAVETIAGDQPAVSTIPVKIDTGKDYEIETVVSVEWNRKSDFMGIVWNRSLNGGYYLGFNKDFQIKLFTKEYNVEKVLKPVKHTNLLLPKYTKNTITIRKIGKEFKIYVNKILLYTVPTGKADGDHIGYFVGKASEIRAYSLTVSYLE